MTAIDFYFDFISPYAYLAHSRLPDLAKAHGATIHYHPVNLKFLKDAALNTGPATAQMPLKLNYAIADFKRWGQRYNVPFAFATSGIPDPLPSNKGAFYAIDRGQATEYVARMWHATFGSGGHIGSEDVLRQVASDLGWDADDFLNFIRSEDAASRFEDSSQKAHERGVFGVPMMMVGDEMWWGNDRLDFLEEHLALQAVN